MDEVDLNQLKTVLPRILLTEKLVLWNTITIPPTHRPIPILGDAVE